MGWTNYHSHTYYCDGTNHPEDYVLEAVGQGLLAYGFSSHAPVPFSTTWNMAEESFKDYIREIDQLKIRFQGELDIYKGCEVDYIPSVIGPASFLSNHPQLDYTIGSVHFVDELDDGTPWEVDGRHHVFQQGLGEIFDGDIKAAISRYQELTREMVQMETPSVVGHLDKIKIHNLLAEAPLFREQENWYQEEINHTLETVSKSNAVLEVNTRGMYKGKSPDTYPSPWILDRAFELGIPVQINSDSHAPREITYHFNQAAKVVYQAGYRRLMVLLQGRWQELDFAQNGMNRGS